MISFKNFLIETTEKCLTNGAPNECYENARKEYWALKNKGHNPTYHVGTLSGSYDNPSNNKYEDNPKKSDEILHAWIENKEKIYDPTHFKYGQGDYKFLSTRPANKHWIKTNYKSMYSVPEHKLLKELKTFPSKV